MAHDIIMPMLGMAQDTGIIVAWKKKPGDAVRATDVLMEVETDKSTVEVEAGHDGYLASVMAETGVPIPVGQVVAVISGDKADVGVAAAKPVAPSATVTQDNAPAPAKPAPAAAPPPALTPAAPPAPRPAAIASATGGRVLASPKARREAEARGVDLGRLVRLGVPEPIHVADLARAGMGSAQASATSLMRVRVECAPFEAFLEWVDKEAGVAVEALHIWAAFAAGSLRAATGLAREAEIVVEASRFPENNPVALKNPDLAGLAGIKAEATSGTAAFTVLDLTETPLTEYRPAGRRPLPHLTVANGEHPENFDLYLEFDPAALPAEVAYGFLKDLADRTQVPLRHLL
jgi:pyruvate dehydrogenase E2 component (dihydrolipoamide acetyltransferase)/2-oxoglutarate dehydrogenase E2 component (dihydrolipoamide succinyltransferase)